jgi:hypothetical protein
MLSKSKDPTMPTFLRTLGTILLITAAQNALADSPFKQLLQRYERANAELDLRKIPELSSPAQLTCQAFFSESQNVGTPLYLYRHSIVHEYPASGPLFPAHTEVITRVMAPSVFTAPTAALATNLVEQTRNTAAGKALQVEGKSTSNPQRVQAEVRNDGQYVVLFIREFEMKREEQCWEECNPTTGHCHDVCKWFDVGEGPLRAGYAYCY